VWPPQKPGRFDRNLPWLTWCRSANTSGLPFGRSARSQPREALQQKGMNILVGAVSFVGPHTVRVGDQRISAKKVIIESGAEPVIPSLPGLSSGSQRCPVLNLQENIGE
jgi:hypothetical protein